MNQQDIVRSTITYVKKTLEAAESGHDWWHIFRVWKMAKSIAQTEEVDLLTVELAALLHDIADAKFHKGDEEIGPAKARHFLRSLNVESETIQHVVDIIRNISFRKQLGKINFYSRELSVVQDADRLDAIGAIGIARAFSYGGYKNRPMYDPDIPIEKDLTQQKYINSSAPTINHFYEKLLELKDQMKTAAGREIAKDRHSFMEAYLVQFYREWPSK